MIQKRERFEAAPGDAAAFDMERMRQSSQLWMRQSSQLLRLRKKSLSDALRPYPCVRLQWERVEAAGADLRDLTASAAAVEVAAAERMPQSSQLRLRQRVQLAVVPRPAVLWR